MPELPEVEHLRRSLEPHLLGRTVTRATVHRRDIIATPADPPSGYSRSGLRPTSFPRIPRADLLVEQQITALTRKGKQLAIHADSNRILLVALGMTGTLLHLPHGARNPHPDHHHLTLRLSDAARLIFRDPRRFGGIWTFPDPESLIATRWASLGPDALTADPKALADRLTDSISPIKARLLDQRAIAGVGNIYADEALFKARIHPETPANQLTPAQRRAIARHIQAVMHLALSSGGSSIRDYRDANGSSGSFQSRHLVYGRAGLPCTTCRTPLESALIAQRTTVWCPHCQPNHQPSINPSPADSPR